MSILSSLFKNTPKNHFKLPMNDFVAVGKYNADDTIYEIFQHKETRVQLIINVDTLEVVDIKAGRFLLNY